jgi:hypothetical protein
MNRKGIFVAAVASVCLLMLAANLWAGSEKIGEAAFARGVVTAGPKGGEVRFLGKGMPLYEGDVITTGKRGFAIIHMKDGSKVTLRPDTVFALETFSLKRGKENAFFRLFKGGLRAVTGFISKRNPRKGYRLATPTAVIGIRGTEFDARLCEGDCEEESRKIKGRETRVQSPVVGRVIRLRGRLIALSKDGETRRLVKGGPVYVGDTLGSGAGGFATVVFRDNSRVTLQGESRFKVEEYMYKASGKGSAFFRLLKGGLRIFTGMLSKRSPGAFKVGTPTAVIGVRGTGFDVRLCEDDCAGETVKEEGPDKAGAVAGRVARVKGALIARTKKGSVRRLKQGGPVYEGDTLETAEDGRAMVVFMDRSRVTLLEGSTFRVEEYRFKGKKGDSGFFRLLKGGIRTLTGLLARNNPKAFKLGTPTAVIGVRGTGFDAYLRGEDVAQGKQAEKGRPVSGRLVRLKGRISAAADDNSRRPLKKGGPVYEGDTLETGPNSRALVVFRDNSRVTLLAGSTFRVDKYQYKGKGEDSVFLRLIKGGLRTFTGLIAKRDKKAFKLGTPTAVVGIRGSGVDLRHGMIEQGRDLGAAVPGEDSLLIHVWDGAAELIRDNKVLLVIDQDQTAFLPRRGAEPIMLPTTPGIMLMFPEWRPDKVKVNMKLLFPVETRSGLYLSVWDGAVELKPREGEGLVVEKDQTALLPKVGGPLLLMVAPPFMPDDRTWRPDRIKVDTQKLLGAGAKPGLYVNVWKGVVELKPEEGKGLLISRDQTGFLPDRGEAFILPVTPLFIIENPALRPDGPKVDMKNLFGAEDRDRAAAGLYVSVYEGHVTMENKSGSIDLGKGEAGYSDPMQVEIVRLARQPLFQVMDRFPMPDMFDEKIDRIMEIIVDELGDGARDKGVECEIK